MNPFTLTRLLLLTLPLAFMGGLLIPRPHAANSAALEATVTAMQTANAGERTMRLWQSSAPSGALAATPQPTQPPCGIVTLLESAPVYALPRPDQAVIGRIAPSDLLLARGRIRGGWLLTDWGGEAAWVAPNDVQMYGACSGLPTVLDPAIPRAPVDEEAYMLSVDRDGVGQISEQISYPYDDTLDVVWINVLNLYNLPPSNYREFTVTLACEGVGTEAVRWGSPEGAVLTCGAQTRIPFIVDVALQPLVVLIPEGAEQSFVRYTFYAVSSHRAA